MHPVLQEDIPKVAQLLAQAFDDNKSVNRCIKQGSKRKNCIYRLMRYVCKTSVRNKMAFIHPSRNGVLLCTYSNGIKPSFWDDLQYILQVSGLKLGLKLLKRERLLNQRHAKNKYCHLWFIGMDASHQGKGIGSEMMTSIKKVCQMQKMDIYLETSNLRNLAFYEQNGFTCYLKEQLTTDDFPLYFFKWSSNEKAPNT